MSPVTRQRPGAIRAALETSPLTLEAGFNAIHPRLVYADLFSTSDTRIVQGLARVRTLIQIQGDTP